MLTLELVGALMECIVPLIERPQYYYRLAVSAIVINDLHG